MLATKAAWDSGFEACMSLMIWSELLVRATRCTQLGVDLIPQLLPHPSLVWHQANKQLLLSGFCCVSLCATDCTSLAWGILWNCGVPLEAAIESCVCWENKTSAVLKLSRSYALYPVCKTKTLKLHREISWQPGDLLFLLCYWELQLQLTGSFLCLQIADVADTLPPLLVQLSPPVM